MIYHAFYVPHESSPAILKQSELKEMFSLNGGSRTEIGLGSYASSELPRESGCVSEQNE